MPALENAVTEVRARLMISAVDNWDVTANAEQIPRTCKVMGLFSTNGSTRTFLFSSVSSIVFNLSRI